MSSMRHNTAPNTMIGTPGNLGLQMFTTGLPGSESVTVQLGPGPPSLRLMLQVWSRSSSCSCGRGPGAACRACGQSPGGAGNRPGAAGVTPPGNAYDVMFMI